MVDLYCPGNQACQTSDKQLLFTSKLSNDFTQPKRCNSDMNPRFPSNSLSLSSFGHFIAITDYLCKVRCLTPVAPERALVQTFFHGLHINNSLFS